MGRGIKKRESGGILYLIMMSMLCGFMAAMLFLLSGKEKQTLIVLQYDTAEISGAGADISGTGGAGADSKVHTVTISRSGSYRISGTLENGQVYVDVQDEEEVELVLDGADIFSEDSAAVYIENAAVTSIVLAENTKNSLQSGSADEAALYAKDDLFITGTGALQVSAVHNGIHTKKRLLIESGNITVKAGAHALKGKESVSIAGGDLELVPGKKGIESDFEVSISGGNVLITDSAEGIEANQVLITGGVIDITASDDGINASGGAAKKKKKPEEDIVEKMPNLKIQGGEVSINAEGDGLDSNGNLLIEGGIVIIDGPTRDDDGALDFGTENGGVCIVNGGTVLALGSAGMAVGFDESSKQPSFCHILEAPYQAGGEILILDAEGEELYRHVAVKKGVSIVFSAPYLTYGETYFLSIDGQRVEVLLTSD